MYQCQNKHIEDCVIPEYEKYPDVQSVSIRCDLMNDLSFIK